MKRLLLIPLLFALVVLPGCTRDFATFFDKATTTYTNPVSAVDIYRVKNVYAASLELLKKYRQFCWSRPYAELMQDPVAKPICESRRPAVRAMLDAERIAANAIVEAENFVRNNPTLNAMTAISAAWSAVTRFQNTMPRSL